MLQLPLNPALLPPKPMSHVVSSVAPAECYTHQRVLGHGFVLLADGRGGTYVLPTHQVVPVQQVLSNATHAQPMAPRLTESNPVPTSSLQHKRQHDARDTVSGSKRARVGVESPCCSSQSNGGVQPAELTEQPACCSQPQAVRVQGPAPPASSDDESANSTRSCMRTSCQSQIALVSSSASIQQQRFVVVKTPQGHLQLLSTGALLAGAAVQPSAPAGYGAAPLTGALQVPAGILMPQPAGLELRPAQPAVAQVKAAISHPGHELRLLATATPSVIRLAPWLDQDRMLDSALAEVQEVMLHKPRGRPVKYIDLGVNRMALKHHVGLRISGKIESMGACDSELAAHILLDLAKIGLGLYSPAAAAAPPPASVHADEQMCQQLMAPAYRYSSQLVQRVVAQLINRSLVPANELLHAFTRAAGAGCKPHVCMMSVSAALSSSTAQCVTKVKQ